jgi:predicted NodU family carbamoyl transferase
MESDGPRALRAPGRQLGEFISIKKDDGYEVNAPLLLERVNGTSGIAKRLGPQRTPESEIDESFKNVAFAVQDACEMAMMALVKLATQKTGCRNVCMAGGVALNSKANGKIEASGIIDKLFVQPALPMTASRWARSSLLISTMAAACR